MQPAITSLVEFSLATAGATTLSFSSKMRPRILASLFGVFLAGCDSNTNADFSKDSTMKSYFKVTDRSGDNSYEIEQAVYGVFKYSYGYELTLNLESPMGGQMGDYAKFEVSLFFKERPEITEGSKWVGQPGEIDKEHLGIMSNFYKGTHDSFDQFSVDVLRIDGDNLICRVEGNIGISNTTVSACASFTPEGWQREEAEEEGEQVVVE